MKKLMTVGLLCLSIGTLAESQEPATQARNHALLLGKTLQAELMQAMQAGGAPAAVAVCNTKAMPISAQISEQTGWQVARTSLKVRNAANTADAWEAEQMQAFEQRLKQGESPATLESYAVVEQDGKKLERFMKAIPTQEGCLACHGDKISTELSQQLYSLYPNDQARGFAVGQLRGAFTLQRAIEP